MNDFVLLKFVSSILLQLRDCRDREQRKDIRQSLNDVCDRVDVLESKLIKASWLDKVTIGDSLIAIENVPCPIQHFEIEFFKNHKYTIVFADDECVGLEYDAESGLKPSIAKFSRRPGQKFDFLGEWFYKN
jgi:hypothetical protein